jgi:hypothetical protein
MKVKVDTGIFCGKVAVNSRRTEISGENNFVIDVEEIKDPELVAIELRPANVIRLIFKNQWEVEIGRDVYDGKNFIVTRFFRNNNDSITNEQYMTQRKEWKPRPDRGPLPDDALRIPMFENNASW